MGDKEKSEIKDVDEEEQEEENDEENDGDKV
jgi:hypothetical protein